MPSIDLKEFQEKISTQFRPWQRSFQFWVRAADIYAGYKVFQIKVSFEKDVEKAEAMWERHHEYAADKIYNMCYDMGGFFLKVAQVVGKPDLAPAAWVRKLVTLCDQAPGTPSNVVRLVLEKELGRSVDEMFERFDWDPIGSASIAQKWKNRKVLAMEYIDGIPILNLKDEIIKRGIDPDGKIAAAAKQNILKSLSLAYGHMILESGFFHADPHPGNILICKGSEVALLDYGQVKELPNPLRLGYANLVLAIADNDHMRASEGLRELGIDTLSLCEDERAELFKLAQVMFDTKLPPGVTMLQPFAEDSSLKKIAVQAFPEELFSVLRTVHLLRGLSVGLGVNYSCAEEWRPIAEEALYSSGRLKDEDLKSRNRHRRRFFRRWSGWSK